LFSKIGPVQSLRLKYDKLGRSDGVAFVTYSSIDDANEAIRKYNGANAAGTKHKKAAANIGQPITVTLDNEGPRRPKTIGFPARSHGRGYARGSQGGRMPTGRGAGPSGSRSGPRQPRRTQEELDKELDDFMSTPVQGENGNGDAMAID
jgi:THO complex subunit 4